MLRDESGHSIEMLPIQSEQRFHLLEPSGWAAGDLEDTAVQHNAREDPSSCDRSRLERILLFFLSFLVSWCLFLSLWHATCRTPRDELRLFLDMKANGNVLASWPLKRAQFWADLANSPPLSEVLAAGFCSVATKAWYVRGELVVVENASSEASLRKVFLEPLVNRVVANQTCPIYQRARRLNSCLVMTLVVDLQSTSDIHAGWDYLESTLHSLDEGHTIFETISGSRNHSSLSPLRILVRPGHDPSIDTMASSMLAKYSMLKSGLQIPFDALTPTTLPLARIVTNSWPAESHSMNETLSEVRDFVSKAHSRSLEAMFDESAPQDTHYWDLMLRQGADWIGSASMYTLRTFLLSV